MILERVLIYQTWAKPLSAIFQSPRSTFDPPFLARFMCLLDQFVGIFSWFMCTFDHNLQIKQPALFFWRNTGRKIESSTRF